MSIDLLKENRDGLLRADKAIKGCFQDIDAHMRQTEVAVDGAVQGVLAAISPELIRKEIDAGFDFKSHDAKCWEHYVHVHESLSGDPDKRRQAYHTHFRQSYNQTLMNNTDRTVK